MLPLFIQCCDDLISKWEEMLSSDGSSEIDVWPFVKNLTADVISRTAFGSSYLEGRRIFQLLKEKIELTLKMRGQRLVPKRMMEIDRDIKASLMDIINKRDKALKAGEATKNNLLDILLESNHKEIEEQGNNKNVGMNLEEVIEECKLFYFAGQDTTSVLLVWTMILLSRYPDWQARAREEVSQVFGNQKPTFDGLNQLKIVTMILYEVLRLYPPGVGVPRKVIKDVKLGNLSFPDGVEIFISTILVHHDSELWGDDAKEFKPERFSEGVLKATNGSAATYPLRRRHPPGPEPFTYLDDFPRPDPNHDEMILAIPRAASDKNISTKERRARRLRSIVFEQEDDQHSGKKHLIYPPSPFVAKSVAREDDIRECATTVHAANSNVLSGIGFSRPVFHHDGSWLVAYFIDAFDLAGSKGRGGSGNISALLSGVPWDVNMQLLQVTSGMTFSSKTIGGNLNSKVKFVVMKGSTLMKPTASLLAKQNQPHPIVSSR
ncbi:hypothetical protein JHK84_043742 [Glycine max]|nr:hypothetical protein JHK85_044221 [Glycine max]KAG5117629.1 hypothetical protein JHK84_043742 [Glycine max]